MSRDDLREALGALAVVASLVFVGMELRQNRAVMEREATRARTDALSAPFFGTELPAILEKIKAVDGYDRYESAFMERYDVSYAEAVAWNRHQLQLWYDIQSEYLTEGPSDDLTALVTLLLQSEDNQVYVEHSLEAVHDRGFVDFVQGLGRGEVIQDR